jgi:hypothetical protein
MKRIVKLIMERALESSQFLAVQKNVIDNLDLSEPQNSIPGFCLLDRGIRV